jgi:hypothetical protein
MRTFDLADDIIPVLTMTVRAIPDVFLDFDPSVIQVQKTEALGVFDVVAVLDEAEELLIGEIILDDDYVAFIDIFED